MPHATSVTSKTVAMILETYRCETRKYDSLLKHKDLLQQQLELSIAELQGAAAKTALAIVEVIDLVNTDEVELELGDIHKIKREAEFFGILSGEE